MKLLAHENDPHANGYYTWYVSDRRSIPDAHQGGTGANPHGCDPTTTNLCHHWGAVDPAPIGPILFYQVRHACDGTEAAE